VTAITLVAELHDFRRFATARARMAYLGLVPSEYSSGLSRHRGSITKTGNRHVRRVLVETAWHYRHRGKAGKILRARRQDQRGSAVQNGSRFLESLAQSSRFSESGPQWRPLPTPGVRGDGWTQARSGEPAA